ncbi:hypothetical protein BDV06DRAFT_186432 [Aspergillus oleicola]
MSFLDSVLSSIETGKPNPMPTSSPAPTPAISSSNSKPETRRPVPAARPVPIDRKNGVPAGVKRKADEPLPRTQKPGLQLPARSAPAKPGNTRTPLDPRSTITSRVTKPSTSSSATAPRKTPPAPSVPSKAPPKGSFAELMAKAKAAQQNAPTQVGTFKHQAVPKEKLSKMERRKRLMEAQAKEKDAKQPKKAGASSSASAAVRPGSAKAPFRRETEQPTYKGTARPPPQMEYRGTANLPSRNGDHRQLKANKRSRMDEYLGTDEEDEGEYADDYDDYYSESSDMEAGLDDVEQEEAKALAAARREDEEDIRAEAAAKQEKLERRKKLSMLASRR